LKYAMPLTSGHISGHFGNTEQFVFFTADFNLGLSNTNIVDVPNIEHSAIAGWLADQQVEGVIANGIELGARQLLGNNNIKVITNATDTIER